MRQSIVRCACVNATTVGKFRSVTRFVSQIAFPFPQKSLSMIGRFKWLRCNCKEHLLSMHSSDTFNVLTEMPLGYQFRVGRW